MPEQSKNKTSLKVINDRQATLVERSSVQLEILNTLGDGNCAFHAILGQLRVQGTNEPVVVCDNVQAERKRVADAVRTCIRSGNRQDPFFMLIAEVLRDVVTHPEFPTSLSRIKAYNEQRVNERGERLTAATQILEANLRQHREIYNYIEQNSREANFMAKFQACLELNQGQLRRWIAADNQLNAHFTEYKNASADINFLENYLLGTPTVVEEYAQYLERFGNWLLSSELKIIAHVNEVSVEFYYGDTHTGTFNRGRNRTVLVRHDGSAHYEQLVRQEIPHLMIQLARPTPQAVPMPPTCPVAGDALQQTSKAADDLIKTHLKLVGVSAAEPPVQTQAVPESTIEIRIKRNLKDNTLTLEVIQTASKLSPMIRFEKKIFLTSEGKLDVGKMHLPHGPLKAMMGDAALLNISGVEGDLALQADGSILLSKLKSQAYVKLSTSGNIIVNTPIEAAKLTLHGKDITIHNETRASGDLVLQADGVLNNFHTLQGQNIKIAGTGKLQNAGLVKAQRQLNIRINATDNKGSIIGNFVKVQSESSAQEAISNQIPKPQKYFNNSGVVLGIDGLTCMISGAISNQRLGEILSYKDVTIKAGSRFNNASQIVAKGHLLIEGYQYVANEGTLFSDKGTQLRSDKLVSNAGTVQSLKYIVVDSKQNFCNQTGGKFNAETLNVQSKRELKNLSVMVANGLISLGSDAPIINTATGKIYSNTVVNILGLKELNNLGEITGHLQVTTKSIGDTLNGVSASIQGGVVALSTLNTFGNSGTVAATECLSIKGKSVYNAPNASLHSAGLADIQSQTILTNDGKASAQHLLIQAVSLINQVRTGDLISFDTLTLQIKNQLDNFNKIHAAGELKIMTETLNNLRSAKILSAKKIQINSQKLNNQGVIEAENLFLKIAAKLCNSPAARMAATECLELSAQSVENSSQIVSKRKVLIEGVQKLVNNLQAYIGAEEWVKLLNCSSIENLATITTRGNLFITALHEFTNLTEGKVEGRDVKITAEVFRNHNSVKAERNLTIETRLILDNVLRSLILAGERLELFSENILQNAGNVTSKGALLLRSHNILKNLNEGRVVAEEDLQLLAGHVLSNAGMLAGKKSTLLNSSQWLINLLDAKIYSEGDVTVDSTHQVENQGTIYAKHKLSLNALRFIRNYQGGTLAADVALKGVSDYFINQGTVCSEQSLSLDLNVILDNYHQGKIFAKTALQLCSACILKNAGLVRSEDGVTVSSTTFLETLAGSEISSQQRLNLLSDFVIKNAGKVVSEQIGIEAKELLMNSLKGQIAAQNGAEDRITVLVEPENSGIDARSRYISNAGALQSNHNISLQADALWNLSSGKINATEALKAFTKEHTENNGVMFADKAALDAPWLVNRGLVATLKDLSINVTNTLNHCAEGTIAAEGAIVVLARDLQLMGQLIAKGNFSATVERYFDYNPATLMASGLLKLMLKQGYDFTKPINTPGSLSIQTPGDSTIQAPIQTGQDFEVNTRNTTIKPKGGIFAQGKLTIDASQILKVAEGAYLASKGDMTVTASVAHLKGELCTQANLILQALALIDNTGNICANGNATISASQIRHTQASYRPEPIISVGGNCVFNGNTYVHDGKLGIGGQFTVHGSLLVRSTEEEARLAAAQAEMENANRRAKRKAKRKKRLKMGFTLGIAIAGAFIMPAATAQFVSTSGKFLVGVGGGALFGGASSAVNGGNVLKGAFLGGVFAGFGFGMQAGLDKMVTPQIFNIQSEAVLKGIKETLHAASTAGLHTAVHGGNYLQNILLSVGASTINHCIFPEPSQVFGQALNSQGIMQQMQHAVIRSLVTTGLAATVNKTDLGSSLMAAGMGALQAYASAQGHNVGLRMQAQKPQGAPLSPANKPVHNARATLARVKNRELVKTPIPHTSNRMSQPVVKNGSTRPTNRQNKPLASTFPTVSEELHQFYTPSYSAHSGVNTRSNHVTQKNALNTAGQQNRVANSEAYSAKGNNSNRNTTLVEKIVDFFVGPVHAEEMMDTRVSPPGPAQTKVGNTTSKVAGRNVTQKTATEEISWGVMAYRALSGDRSPEVLRWQQQNRQQMSMLADFSDGLQSAKPIKVMESSGRGLKDSFIEMGTFLGEEAARLRLGQTTKTQKAIVSAGTFLGEEAARLRLGEDTRTGQFFNVVGTFLGEEATRLRLGTPTITGAAISKLSAEQIAYGIGKSTPSVILFAYPLTTFRLSNSVNISGSLIKRENFTANLLRANSPVDYTKMRVELALREANFIDSSGKLTKAVLAKPIPLISGKKLRSSSVIKALTKDGSNILDWTKYTTKDIILFNGQKIQIHYYMNIKTKKIDYNIGYKVKERVESLDGSEYWRNVDPARAKAVLRKHNRLKHEEAQSLKKGLPENRPSPNM